MHQKWTMLISSIVMTFVVYLIEASYGRLIVEFITHFKDSDTIVLTLTGSFVLAFEQLFSWIPLLIGKLFSRASLLITGILIGIVGLLLTSCARNEYQLLVSYGILYGVGCIFMINVGMFLLGVCFPPEDKHYVLATSLKVSIYPFAAAATPIINMVVLWIGWRYTYLVFVAVVGLVGAVVAIFYGRYQECSSPQGKSVQVDDVSFSTKEKIIVVLIIITKVLTSMSKAIFVNMPVYILTEYSRSRGFDINASSHLVAYFGIAEGCSRLLTCLLGDRLLKRKLLYTYIISCVLGALVNISLGFRATVYTELVLYSVLSGLIMGPIVAGSFASNVEIFQGLYLNELYSVGAFGYGIGYMTGLIVDGAIHNVTKSFQGVFVLCAIMQVFSALCTGLIMVLRRYLPIWIVSRNY